MSASFGDISRSRPTPARPALGVVRLADLMVDDVADVSADAVANWSAANERVMARTTACFALLTLRQVLRFAVRRGWMPVNSATLLEPAEKPRWRPHGVEILEGDDLARVLDHGYSNRALLTVLAFSGLRIGEALGLCWRDIDFDIGVLRVHRQWTRYREHARLKTEAGRRRSWSRRRWCDCCVPAGWPAPPRNPTTSCCATRSGVRPTTARCCTASAMASRHC